MVAASGLAEGWGGFDSFGGDVIVLEAGNGDISADQAKALGESVRQGKGLLLTLARNPGLTPMKLGFLLPTTAWETATHYDDRNLPGAIAALSWDEEFFAKGEPKGVVLPFHYAIRPLAAAERGQARYERFPRKIQHLDVDMGPNDDFWSRSLLNRDRKVRLRGNDVFQSPLLVTGRYGAGRVAIFAGPAESLSGGVKSAVMSWLKPVGNASGDSSVAPKLSVETLEHGVRVYVQNPGAAALSVELVSRALTWEGTLLGAEGESSQRVDVPANGTTQVEISLPVPSLTNYQALDASDAFEVRVGALSASGATLLAQKRVSADFRPALRLSVKTDNLYKWEYPFHAPGPESLALFDSRMGAEIGAYAYAPGAKVNAEVVISNGTRDLSLLALVKDETTPANPSVSAINDGAMVFNKVPTDAVSGYGMWSGQPGVENVLTFTFGHPVTVASVVLVGAVGKDGESNPTSASVELDGKKVAGSAGLDFESGFGRARLSFTPAKATKVTVRMPPMMMPGKKSSKGPGLGEILVEGWNGDDPAAVQSRLEVRLVDQMSGVSTVVSSKDISVKAGATERMGVSLSLPNAKGAHFYRLEAKLDKAVGNASLMALQPTGALLPHSDLRPKDAPSIGLIVSRGFREAVPVGAGTGETVGGWAQPDDLVWAYAHQFKEVNSRAKTEADRLYVTEGNMQHYISPWRTFNNGVPFYDVGAPTLLARFEQTPNWNKSKIAILGHSDRWDAGPDVGVQHSWQEFVEFDLYLRAQGKDGIKGKTRAEVSDEIHSEHESAWQGWHLNNYVSSVKMMRDAFAGQGKDLIISSQGVPMVAGPSGVELAKTLRGMSDDHTWGMMANNIVATTGRQMSMLAHNPVWKMSTLLQWGYTSSNLDNPQWHAPVGTTEPSRRMYYDRAWRATVRTDGSYGSMHTYGYNSNAGISFLMTPNDWQQWWLVEERHSLLAPQEPIGAGVVISSALFADPEHIRFTAAGNTFAESPDALTLALGFQRLHEAGLSVPFSANAAALANWKGNAPLVILNLELFYPDEIATLAKLQARGVPMAALTASTELPAGAAELFKKPGTLLIPMDGSRLTAEQAKTVVQKLQTSLKMPLRFSDGLAGYGFRADGTSYVVVEDWMEKGRMGEVRMQASAGMSKAKAVNVNDHVPLTVTRDGGEWVIATTTRPGDGTLLAIQEEA